MRDLRERELSVLCNLTRSKDVLPEHIQKVYDRAKHLACTMDMNGLSDMALLAIVLIAENSAEGAHHSPAVGVATEPIVIEDIDPDYIVDTPHAPSPSSNGTFYLPTGLDIGQKVAVSFTNVPSREGMVVGVGHGGRVKVEFPNGKIKQVWASRITTGEPSVG